MAACRLGDAIAVPANYPEGASALVYARMPGCTRATPVPGDDDVSLELLDVSKTRPSHPRGVPS